MNERIKELADQTHLFTDYEGTPQYKVWGFTDAGLEQFAEMLIRDCINTACIAYLDNKNLSKEMMKFYFGVEE